MGGLITYCSIFIRKKRGKRAKDDENAKKAEIEEEPDDNEELENLEDDYAYYYGSEEGEDSASEGLGFNHHVTLKPNFHLRPRKYSLANYLTDAHSNK